MAEEAKMSASTSRVSLYKPAGGENVNVTTDLNNNFDKIDTNLNFRVVADSTARNAISPYWEGLNVIESDTGKTYVSNGSDPLSGSWSEIPNSGASYSGVLDLDAGATISIGVDGSTTAALGSSTSSVEDDFLSERLTGDSNSRYLVKADGKTWWGSGSATQDTNLYRDSASVLKTDDNLVVDGTLTVQGVGFPTFILKTTTTDRVSSPDMADDPDLQVALEANSSYLIEISMRYVGDTGATLKTEWGIPANTACNKDVIGAASTGTTDDPVEGRFGVHGSATDVVYGHRSSSAQMHAFEQGIINTVDAGTFVLRWCQSTSSTQAVSMCDGSWMRVTKLA